MRRVVAVPLPAVLRQLLARVAPPLEREDLQVVGAEVAVEELVLLPHVLLEQLEGAEGPPSLAAALALLADGTGVLQEAAVRPLDALRREVDAEAAVLQVRALQPRLQDGEGLDLAREDHLGEEISVRRKCCE